MTLKTQMKRTPKRSGKIEKVKTPKTGEKIKTPKQADKIKTPKKNDEPLKLAYENDYNLNQAKVTKFVEALLKVHGSKGTSGGDGNDKKSQLFGAEETPINLQISGIKIPREDRKHLLKVTLPHSPIVDNKDVCLFVKDLEKGLKVDHEDTINHFKDLLREKGVEVASVISLRELKVEYKPYEAKTALCHRHEAFVADERILRFLPPFLGKPFYARKKFPLPINLQAKDLSKELEKTLKTVTLPLANLGSCSMVRIGHTSMKVNHLVDNILQVTDILAKKYPGGFKNIRSIHLKTETSMAIPIHVSDTKSNDIGFVDVSKAKRVKQEPVTDELTTLLDAKVTVMPNFDIKVQGGQIPEDENDDDVEDNEDSDNDEPAAKKVKKETKKSKKDKKKSKVDSDDEDDEAMEKAENEYLNRATEQENDQNQQEEEEQEESEDDEEEGSEGEEEEDEGSDEEDAEESEEEESEAESEEEAPPPPPPAKKGRKSKK